MAISAFTGGVIEDFNLTVIYCHSIKKIHLTEGAFGKGDLMHSGTNPGYHSLACAA